MATSTAHLTTFQPRGPQGLWDALAEASSSALELEDTGDAHLAFLARVDSDLLAAELLDEEMPSLDDDLADVIELRDFLARRS